MTSTHPDNQDTFQATLAKLLVLCMIPRPCTCGLVTPFASLPFLIIEKKVIISSSSWHVHLKQYRVIGKSTLSNTLCEDVKDFETSSCVVMYNLQQWLQQPDMNYMSYIGVVHTNDEIIRYIYIIYEPYVSFELFLKIVKTQTYKLFLILTVYLHLL